MGYKTISLSDEAYNALKHKKRKKESFNDLILRLASEPAQKEILELAGSWQGSKVESDKLLKIIYENRKNAQIRRVEL